jgi:hypothetical protein
MVSAKWKKRKKTIAVLPLPLPLPLSLCLSLSLPLCLCLCVSLCLSLCLPLPLLSSLVFFFACLALNCLAVYSHLFCCGCPVIALFCLVVLLRLCCLILHSQQFLFLDLKINTLQAVMAVAHQIYPQVLVAAVSALSLPIVVFVFLLSFVISSLVTCRVILPGHDIQTSSLSRTCLVCALFFLCSFIATVMCVL